MKYRTKARTQITRPVAPFAGAWIEIYDAATDDLWFLVAPFAGAWIEILGTFLPDVASSVAPFAGAWIEINVIAIIIHLSLRRSLRGSVD